MTSRTFAVGILVLGAFAAAPASADRTKMVCDTKTVTSYIEAQRPLIKTACYDPHKNDPNVPAEVKVTAHFVYDATGKVSTVSLVQNNALPVAECIASKVRGWKPPCGPSALDVVFEFKR